MVDENSSPAPDQSASECCSRSEALKRAKEEFEKARALYECVRQQAAERVNSVRETTVGEVIDGVLEEVKRHPGTSLVVAALAGFLLGRLFRR